MTVTESEIESTDSEVGAAAADVDTGTDAGDEVVEDVLVEEISIDGMCGVY